jgi:hypothetical protein
VTENRLANSRNAEGGKPLAEKTLDPNVQQLFDELDHRLDGLACGIEVI